MREQIPSRDLQRMIRALLKARGVTQNIAIPEPERLPRSIKQNDANWWLPTGPATTALREVVRLVQQHCDLLATAVLVVDFATDMVPGV